MDSVRSWRFPVDVDPETGRICMVEDNAAVRQGIELVLGTQRGERPLRTTFGSDIQRFMFETVNVMMVDDMAQSITRTIGRWERHVKNMSVNVTEDAQENEAVRVEFEYETDLTPAAEHMEKTLDQDGWK